MTAAPTRRTTTPDGDDERDPVVPTDCLPIILAQSGAPLWMLQHLPAALFVFCFGACVGSFVNVVNYRLPAGMSVITPPSRCPTCGARLRFIRENLPILGWFILRGRCRYCKARISPEYMVLEVVMAVLFLALYVAVFAIHPTTEPWGGIGGWWWYVNGFFRAWPAYFVLALMIAALVSMTIIDARTFTIPIQVPLFATAAAFIGWALQAVLPARSPLQQTWPIPTVGWTGTTAAVGMAIGLGIGLVLLKSGRLRYSFADYYDYVDPDQPVGDYPHARREMVVELLFLAPALAGLALGWFAGRWMPEAPPPHLVQALAGALAGYLVGGGLIWGIRILGTLAFGREAMGLGDVHLLAAVGAALGWWDPILIFFLAPFFGLAWAIASMGLATIFRSARRELPYGPHLALATILLVAARPGIDRLWSAIMPFPQPAAGFRAPAEPVPGRPMPAPLRRPSTIDG